MSSYILTARLTEKGRSVIIDDLVGVACNNSLEQVRQAAREMGIIVNQAYVTLGDDDFVIVVDAPDSQTMAKFALAIGAQGKVTTRTAQAFNEKEAADLFSAKDAEAALRKFSRAGG